MRTDKPKVVFDTNVYISAFLKKGGRAEEAYLFAIDSDMRIYASFAILAEVAAKLMGKFTYSEDDMEAVIKHISRAAILLNPPRKISIIKDDPDNRLLECAEEAGADFIVTGDKHLLRLKEFEKTKIVTIADFLKSCKPA